MQVKIENLELNSFLIVVTKKRRFCETVRKSDVKKLLINCNHCPAFHLSI